MINAVHRTHPGQVGMIRLANLIWFPQIHRTIALRAENCRQCLDQGKNLKSIKPKSELGTLPKLSEPNEELQMDFAGPIPDAKNNNIEHYILAAVDRFSRYPSAVVHTNCDTQTAIEFLNQYCKFHGIPRSIRCDQAQAFKSRTFEIFCKEKNIKLIFSPTHDHRASGMVERLIQTLKRRLATMNIDPIWDNTTIAEKISEIIESIRLIPTRVTKISPFQAHFGRPKNTELSNILTKPNTHHLSYDKIKSFYLDKRLLQNPSLTPAAIWDRDTNSELNLDIQYKPDTQPQQDSQPEDNPMSDTSDSDNAPLMPPQKGTIIPSKFKFTIGDKTTIIDQTRCNVARKTIRRKNPEPRGTLKPIWSIIPDGTIVDYSPHTITIDTHNRKNTVIRNNDIAISTETRPKPQETIPQEAKLRLINFVACKTVGEYNRNKHTSTDNQKQGTSTPIGEEETKTNAPSTSLSISPILTGPKRFKKKTPPNTQKGKRGAIRKKATISAAQKSANSKLTKAKLAALKQTYAFHLSQSPTDFKELSKKSTTRIFKEKSTGNKKPFIIAASSSAADFMQGTPNRSMVTTIAKSPPLRDPRKFQAEPTLKKLRLEKALSNITLTPSTDESHGTNMEKETTIIDLVDTSEEPQTPLSINPNCSTFGQDIVILSSDSQESNNSFHTASINSVPTRNMQPDKPHAPVQIPKDPERATTIHDIDMDSPEEDHAETPDEDPTSHIPDLNDPNEK